MSIESARCGTITALFWRDGARAMIAFLMAAENVVFVSALLLMVLIGVVQMIGLGVDTHLDADLDSHPDLLSWLGVGRLPLLMLLVVFLAVFGTVGLLGQQAIHDLTGNLLAPWLAIPLALIVALPGTGARRSDPRAHSPA